MTQCQARLKTDGSRCRNPAREGSPFCGVHPDTTGRASRSRSYARQRGGGSIDLILGNGKYWVLGKGRWLKSFQDRIILPDPIKYQIHLPVFGGREPITLSGPVTLKQLINQVSGFYQERVSKGRGTSYINVADGDQLVELVQLDPHTYEIQIQ